MSAEDQIWGAIAAANRAWSAGRPQEVASLFHDDVVLAFADSHRRLVGREAMVRSYVELCQRVEVVGFRELTHAVDVLGDTAIVNYRFRFAYEANGVPREETGREVLVLRRGPDGRWLVLWRTRFPDGAPAPAGTDN